MGRRSTSVYSTCQDTDATRACSQRAGAEAALAIARDRLVVLVERRREVMAAVVDGDEIEIRPRRRREDRLDRGQAGAGDGPRRQPAVAIGVEGTVDLQVIASRRAPVLPDGIGDGRVGLK